MAEAQLTIRIVTPAGAVYEAEDADWVTIPTAAGIITVYPGHEQLLGVVDSGEIVIGKGDSKVELAVSAGTLEISGGSEINILANTAERAEHIDLARAEEARRRAEEYLKDVQDADDVDYAMIESKIRKELARIDLGSRYRKVGQPSSAPQ